MSKRGAHEGTISKRRDGRWEARLMLVDAQGRRRRKCLYARTRQAVAAKLRAALAAQAGGLPLVDERTTLREVLRTWLATSAKPSVRASTFDSYERITELHLIPALGRVRLARLAPQAVQDYMNAKLEQGLSARTVQYHHAVLRRALGQAERWGMVPRNVARLVSPPRVERREITPPTPDQARALLRALEGDPLEALYVLAMVSGARQGELIALWWEDVDWAEATVTIRATLQRFAGEFRRLEPKTAASRRTLALPPVAVAALRAHRARQLEARLAAGAGWQGAQWDLVFTDQAGGPMSRYIVSRAFTRALRRTGLRPFRFHDLRHATATYMLSQGVPLKVIQRVLGHSQIGVTANIYAHVMPELQRDAVERVGELLWAAS